MRLVARVEDSQTAREWDLGLERWRFRRTCRWRRMTTLKIGGPARFFCAGDDAKSGDSSRSSLQFARERTSCRCLCWAAGRPLVVSGRGVRRPRGAGGNRWGGSSRTSSSGRRTVHYEVAAGDGLECASWLQTALRAELHRNGVPCGDSGNGRREPGAEHRGVWAGGRADDSHSVRAFDRESVHDGRRWPAEECRVWISAQHLQLQRTSTIGYLVTRVSVQAGLRGGAAEVGLCGAAAILCEAGPEPTAHGGLTRLCGRFARRIKGC